MGAFDVIAAAPSPASRFHCAVCGKGVDACAVERGPRGTEATVFCHGAQETVRLEERSAFPLEVFKLRPGSVGEAREGAPVVAYDPTDAEAPEGGHYIGLDRKDDDGDKV